MIEAPEVRVISEDGQQLGIMPLAEAQQIAEEQELDLVEVAPQGTPPVCRVMNFGKFKYEQQKKEAQARKRSHHLEQKELRLGRSVRVDQHDLNVKLRKAREFLERGHRLSVFLQLRGREVAHADLGVDELKQFAEDLSDIAKLDQRPRVDRRRVSMILAPLPNIVRKRQMEQEAERKGEKAPRSAGAEKAKDAPKETASAETAPAEEATAPVEAQEVAAPAEVVMEQEAAAPVEEEVPSAEETVDAEEESKEDETPSS